MMDSRGMQFPPTTWNATDAAYRAEAVPADLIIEAAARDPNATAVLDATGAAYTYRGLLDAAERIAQLLRTRGIGPGDHIAVMGRRHPDTVVAMVAVLINGATLVPCHPDWPVRRLGYVLGATGARAVLGYAADLEHWWDSCPPGAETVTELVLLDVDTQWPAPPARRDIDEPVWQSDQPGAEIDLRTRNLSRIVLADRPTSVLQVGIGDGALLQQLATQVALFTGIDTSAMTVAAAASWTEMRGVFADLVCCAPDQVATRVPGTYDVALLAGDLQQLRSARTLHLVLEQLQSMIRPGGSLVVTDVRPASAQDTSTAGIVAETLTRLTAEHWDAVEARRSEVDVSAHGWDVVLRRREVATEYARPESDPPVRAGLVDDGLLPNIWTRWHLRQPAMGPSSPRCRPGDVAYVIFTSGSTGQPKGVAISNTALVNMLQWTTSTFQFSTADRLLQATSFCFDLSIFDVFGLLSAGGSIRLAGEAELAEPALLADILLNEPITAWNSAPPLLAWILPFLTNSTKAGPGRATMRIVLLAGDWIALSMPDEVRSVFPHAEVISFGGATETTVWSTSFRVNAIDPAWPSIPYGRPMQNARYYVLDEDRRMVPVGEPGELYAAGTVLALGYHGDPRQTALRFVPDPFVPGGRMYACGDRGLWRSDGVLQFLGRVDHQVKIRGFRVELGEIESVIVGLDGIREAVVVTVEEAGARSLSAFYTRRAAGPDPSVVEAALAERLPPYMVPGKILVLDSLPLTVNGKVDRPALMTQAGRLSAGQGVAT